VKEVGERKIIASFVAVKLYSMAEMIGKENEHEKTKVKAPVTTKKDKKCLTSITPSSETAASAVLKFDRL